MTDDDGTAKDQPLLDGGLAFFGAVTASVSHELNNVISIIDQTAGLLDDLIIGEERGIPISVERLTEAVASVQKQTERGLGIIRRLNRFAHSADAPVTEFDVNEVVGNLVALAQRLADLKRARLQLSPSPVVMKLRSNPFFLQQVIFGALKLALAVVERDDVIQVKAESVADGAVVLVACPREVASDGDDQKLVQLVAAHIDGRFSVQSEEGQTEMRMFFPGMSASREVR